MKQKNKNLIIISTIAVLLILVSITIYFYVNSNKLNTICTTEEDCGKDLTCINTKIWNTTTNKVQLSIDKTCQLPDGSIVYCSDYDSYNGDIELCGVDYREVCTNTGSRFVNGCLACLSTDSEYFTYGSCTNI